MKLIGLLILLSLFGAQTSNVTLSFSPEAEKYAEATKQYQSIWQSEGEKIIKAMEEVSGLRFQPMDIRAIVYEGASFSGFKDTPMKLRASYPSMDIKREALVHELGHRLNESIKVRPKDVDDHRVLFLYLYDVWVKLYGKKFADDMVEIEKGRKGLYDYESAWNWALSLSAQERASKLKEIVEKK